MRPVLRATAALASLACLWPAAAAAAPPENDHYLLSTVVARDGQWPVKEPIAINVNTAEATVQPDLFNPTNTGAAGSGGGAEPTRCQTFGYGKTVWFDISARQPGAVSVRATGFDSILKAYEFDPENGRLGREVGCQNTPGLEEEGPVAVEPRHAYTVQIGGVDAGMGPAGGPLQVSFEFFPDRDRDEVLDEQDDCDRLPGIPKAGCPPILRPTPAINLDHLPGGRERISGLTVRAVPPGSRVQARCSRGCSLRQTRTAKRFGNVALKGFVGRTVKAGARIAIRVTHPKVSDPGSRYRFGAIGAYFRYDIRAGRAAGRVDRCLLPGSSKPRRRCRG